MNKVDKIVALIPMRKRSLRIPDKHTRPLAGFPPALRAVNAALGTPDIGAVYVATSNAKIRQTLKGKPVHFIPQKENEKSRTEEIVKTFCEAVQAEIIILIQATNPFVNAWHLKRALAVYKEFDPDTVISGVALQRYFYRVGCDNYINRVDSLNKSRPGVSRLSPLFVENGGFYIFKRERFLKTGSIFSDSMVAYEMPLESFFELDIPQDWAVCESIIKQGITYAGA
jgi:CMP-N-acetylneuraminic acid synthetase